jgi:tRNA pseudouridine38-40 synthase
VDKRTRNEDEQEMKRQRLEKGDDEQLPIYAKKFSEEAIKAEGRRPKKKVAVLIGYAGTGYRGMQLSVSLAWSSRLTIDSRL